MGDRLGERGGEEDGVDGGDGGVPCTVFGCEISPKGMGGEFERDDDG